MFTGRIAVVTGGGSGIGRAVCLALARENASVVIADANNDGARETIGLIGSIDDQQQHLPVHVDVSKNDSVKQLFESVINKYKNAATVLVNCAGITKDSLLVDLSEEDFDKVINVNLKGTFLATKFACKLMKEYNLPGSIVNVSSVSGAFGNVGQANYAASKAGVEGFTRTVAREMAKFNIRCNAVMPGFIDTPIVKTIPDKIITRIIQQIPLARMGTAEEVADAITFLASPKSNYITGTVINISGGMVM